jgi:uncharacterized protein (DUF1684 family)
VEELQVADWRRRISALYAAIRDTDPRDGWQLWRAERERLFLTHPQTPLPTGMRNGDHVPIYFEYDPTWRRVGHVRPAPSQTIILPGSAKDEVTAHRLAQVDIDGMAPLSLFWLHEYSGGLFLSFRDAAAGTTTYGGGRYLLDSAKGADLGGGDEWLIVDFNFAYQPSCSYDPRWNCPLPPCENWLDTVVNAGERSR